MSIRPIIYEQPVNELIRTCLRLEHCFRQLSHTLAGSSLWDSHFTMISIIETSSLLDRPDLKTKLTQEFQRHRENLKKHNESPNVNHSKLNEILKQLDNVIVEIEQTIGKFNQPLKEDKFIEQIRQHLQSGSYHAADSPVYGAWLAQPTENRVAQLNRWCDRFSTIKKSVFLLLKLIRKSAVGRVCYAESGFYQEASDVDQNPSQLIQVEINNGHTVFPEISAGKHRLSIRFLTPSLESKPTQTRQNIKFTLTCCSF